MQSRRNFVFIAFLAGLLVVDGFVYEKDYGNVTRFKRQTKCGLTENECGSGECISEDNVCDGKEDCRDGSDETIACKNIKCAGYLFTCAYGACINSDFKCNGKKDCKDNSDEASSICKQNTDKPNTCHEEQFMCDNGQCIDDSGQCDGVKNCDDGSDETVGRCGSFNCPAYTFKCAYGACINSDLKCNGVQNCIDNSDEEGCNGSSTPTRKPPIVTPKPVTPKPVTPKPTVIATENDCMLPEFPDHGKWSVLGGMNLQPGGIATENTILLFNCQTNYRLKPEQSLAICNKTWNTLPKCIKTCPTLSGKNNLILSCNLDRSEVSCDNPYEGTRATVKCADLYEDPSVATRPYRYCRDGSWDYSLPNCEPVCGLKSVDAQKLVVGGKDATRGEFPWNIGLYQDGEHICGGSLITLKLVLTAAHCFESLATESFLVAAGKYYRALNDTKDDEAQRSKISDIIIHEDYNGGRPYVAFDFAVLVLINPFKLTKYVMPVCLDVSSNFDQSNLINKKGIVVGWGFTQETGNPAEHLKYLEVEYKAKDKCTLPSDFYVYYVPYAPDKLCAGHLSQEKSACKGDSGGGLVFPGDNGRYFVRGIVSVSPRKGSGCDSNQFSLYTSVQYHVDLIEKLKSKYRV